MATNERVAQYARHQSILSQPTGAMQMHEAMTRHGAICSEWLATRPAAEMAVRKLLAGRPARGALDKASLADSLARALAVTSLAGNYERCAGWYVALNASPVGAAATLTNPGRGDGILHFGAGIIWRGGKPRLLTDDQALTLRRYVETLGGWDKPGYWVDGIRSAGDSFHIHQPTLARLFAVRREEH